MVVGWLVSLGFDLSKEGQRQQVGRALQLYSPRSVRSAPQSTEKG